MLVLRFNGFETGVECQSKFYWLLERCSVMDLVNPLALGRHGHTTHFDRKRMTVQVASIEEPIAAGWARGSMIARRRV